RRRRRRGWGRRGRWCRGHGDGRRGARVSGVIVTATRCDRDDTGRHSGDAARATGTSAHGGPPATDPCTHAHLPPPAASHPRRTPTCDVERDISRVQQPLEHGGATAPGTAHAPAPAAVVDDHVHVCTSNTANRKVASALDAIFTYIRIA